MATNDDKKETYDQAYTRQETYFAEHYGCSTSPSFYFIYFNDGGAHWSEMPWGWYLSYLNLEKGDPKQCGQFLMGGIAICMKCYKEKADEIIKKCREFNAEMRENHHEKLEEIKQNGLKIGIITYR
ncbi:unnamed protein product [Adineta ricciae]|uniref:Uncharacterized protein n=1 Tax=Adineta ricciae TaxID=249248 RepID=A0A815EJT6_ADIRI|nr:unnamed protein product [Adineta ricciae]CAF1312463.1 unnamed protein product [Adineta ricciae]